MAVVNGTPFKILIVDDSPVSIQLAADFLNQEGYHLSFARNGEEALELARSLPVDLVLLDIMIPGMDGYEVCARMKKEPRTSAIPIICLTARTERESIMRSIEAGAVDYITKPFDGAELIARVKIHLELKHARELVSAREEDLQREIAKTRAREQELLDVTHKLKEKNRILNRLSLVDSLTGIANRRQFDEALEREVRRCAREKRELALLMFDIDYFKNYNDLYGHLAGDGCLVRVAEVLTESARRPADLAARYGGEEFVIILPDTNSEGASGVAESVRNAVYEKEIPHALSPIADRVTVSAGVICLVPRHGASPESLIEKADTALYAAKKGGRNRVIIFTDMEGGIAICPASTSPNGNLKPISPSESNQPISIRSGRKRSTCRGHSL